VASEGFEPEARLAKAAMPLQGRDRQETRALEKVFGNRKPLNSQKDSTGFRLLSLFCG
jgi:hypothetical protein